MVVPIVVSSGREDQAWIFSSWSLVGFSRVQDQSIEQFPSDFSHEVAVSYGLLGLRNDFGGPVGLQSSGLFPGSL